jgi:hypothetical protein
VLFRTLYNNIERETNRRESCPPNQCHSAKLDGMEVVDGRLFLAVPLFDEVTLGRGCSIRNWSSSRLTGVGFPIWNGKVFFFDEEQVAGCRSVDT